MFLSRYRSLRVLALVMGFACLPLSVSADDLYNHKAPAAYPKWFVPMGTLGVTSWLSSDETSIFGHGPDHYTYIGKSRLSPKQLVSLVEAFAKANHFDQVEVVVPDQQMSALEFDMEKPGSMQRMMAASHNRLVAIEALDDHFTLTLNDGPLQ